MLILCWQLEENESELIERSALEHAKTLSLMIEEVRTLYTGSVVGPALEAGVPVTHDYHQRGQAIPLPATFSMELAEAFGARGGNATASLYSPHPFPWRQESGGLRDEFAENAWRALSEDPHHPFVDVETTDDGRVLRYATADVLRPACVNCHNEHPDTPKRDWRDGDLRGVLEVSYPIGSTIAFARRRQSLLLWTVAPFFIASIAGIGFLAARRKRLISELEGAKKRLAATLVAREQDNLALKKANAELKQSQARVAHASKLSAVGEMASGIAHEINNPLTSVVMNAEFLRSDLQELAPSRRSKSKSHLDVLLHAASRCKHIVETLLGFTRRGQPEKVFFDLRDVVPSALELLRGELSESGVTVDVALPEALSVRGSRQDFEQVFSNLVRNAARVSERGQTIFVTGCGVPATQSAAAKVRLSVRDTGPSIDAEDLKKIFDPFFTTMQDTAGFALSVSRQIVANYGGRLEATSETGVGSCFSMHLPEQKPIAPPSDRPSLSRPSASGKPATQGWEKCAEPPPAPKAVLVVDDDPDVLETIREGLERAGYTVLSATGGAEALKILGEHTVQVLPTDRIMPEMSGLQLIRQVRRTAPYTVAVLMSGNLPESAIDEAKALGVTHFLAKPSSSSELEEVIALACSDAPSEEP